MHDITIRFVNGKSILRTRDGRQFNYSPAKAASKLYTIPHTGLFEPNETQYLSTLIEHDWVCFDIGACFGWYTTLFSMRCEDVHAFEPVRDNYECANDNIRLNNCRNVTLNQLALGNESATRSIFIPQTQVSGSLRPHSERGKQRTTQIEVTTLDAYVSQHNISQIDLIKADIEGGEMDMLLGASNSLARFKPTLMLEIQAHSLAHFGYVPRNVFAYLARLGYQAHTVNDSLKLIPYSHGVIALPHYNFIFMPIY